MNRLLDLFSAYMDYIKKYEESSSLSSIRSLKCSVDIAARGFFGCMFIDLFINLLPFLIFWVWLFLSSALRFRARREFSASLFFCSYNSAFRLRSISRWAACTFVASNCSSSIIRSINRVSTEKSYLGIPKIISGFQIRDPQICAT